MAYTMSTSATEVAFAMLAGAALYAMRGMIGQLPPEDTVFIVVGQNPRTMSPTIRIGRNGFPFGAFADEDFEVGEHSATWDDLEAILKAILTMFDQLSALDRPRVRILLLSLGRDIPKRQTVVQSVLAAIPTPETAASLHSGGVSVLHITDSRTHADGAGLLQLVQRLKLCGGDFGAGVAEGVCVLAEIRLVVADMGPVGLVAASLAASMDSLPGAQRLSVRTFWGQNLAALRRIIHAQQFPSAAVTTQLTVENMHDPNLVPVMPFAHMHAFTMYREHCARSSADTPAAPLRQATEADVDDVVNAPNTWSGPWANGPDPTAGINLKSMVALMAKRIPRKRKAPDS
jgi:hypothetical protein